MRKEVRSMNYNKKMEFNNKQKLLIGCGLVISTLIGYEVGWRRTHHKWTEVLMACYKEDPTLIGHMNETYRKISGKK